MRKNFVTRLLVSAICLTSASLGMSGAWRAGVARLWAEDASRTSAKAQADRAVQLNPTDPETHSSRALALYNAGDLADCIEELQSAALLRPRDYLLWLQLGRARDEAGDKTGALLALQRAVALAPYYSDPRWQLGNVLYRASRFDEAFRELSKAAQSDPSLAAVLMDLAWGTYPGNAGAVERIVSPQTDAARLSLACFFVKQGRLNEALSLFRTSTVNDRKDIKGLLAELFKARQFKAAYEVWSAARVKENNPAPGGGNISDPGFEGRIDLFENGFGWRQEHVFEGVSLSFDGKNSHSGSSCLLIDWHGNAKPEAPIISQLVLTEPRARYHLNFFVRTENVVTGAPPVITVTDGTHDEAAMLGQSPPLTQPNQQWQSYDVVFDTSATTGGVQITLQRMSCPAGPCPMFGRVWLDDFSLRKE